MRMRSQESLTPSSTNILPGRKPHYFSNSSIELISVLRRYRPDGGSRATRSADDRVLRKSASGYYSIVLIQVSVWNPTELFPASEHAETFLNKDRMVATRRILEVRQCSEKSGELTVGTTPGRRKQTFGRGVERRRATEDRGEARGAGGGHK